MQSARCDLHYARSRPTSPDDHFHPNPAQRSISVMSLVHGTRAAMSLTSLVRRLIMGLSIWLPAMVGLGLLAIGLMAAFVRFCDRV